MTLKVPIILTIILLAAGSLTYFAIGIGDAGLGRADIAIYKDIKFKAAYTEEGALKVFASAENNALAKYKAAEGNSIPETNSIVIGSAEAERMKKENLFSKPGDSLKDFFGINTTIGGVLAKTGTPIDEFHFLSENQFSALQGEENRIFVEIEDKDPEMFYSYANNSPLKFRFKEGSLKDYIIHEMAGEKYYPAIFGSTEAQMMIDEKLFTATGDIIKGFLGKNIIIVGILEPTNTTLDIMHILPWTVKKND